MLRYQLGKCDKTAASSFAHKGGEIGLLGGNMRVFSLHSEAAVRRR